MKMKNVDFYVMKDKKKGIHIPKDRWWNSLFKRKIRRM